MRILMSAFSCGPGQGSEPGIGWNWALEAARQGHDVVVVTQSECETAIRREAESGGLPPNLRIDIFTPDWIAWLRDKTCTTRFGPLAWQIVHLLWQLVLPAHLRRTYDLTQFDIVHHITLGGVRHPTVLGGLGPPLVLGPLGGGEKAPFALRRHFRWSCWLKDLARDFHTAVLKLDPITTNACAKAVLVFVKTPQTRQVLKKACWHKVRVRLELGTPGALSVPRAERRRDRPLRILYAGQLVYWKGMGLGLRAVALARSRGHDVCLTMIGRGSEERHWRNLSEQLGIADIVLWRGWVHHDEIDQIYREHDLFLFPSLHDSSGNVVLEALSHALPVICLDLGGPAEMINEACGRVIPVAGRTEDECVMDLASAIGELESSPGISRALSRGAAGRAEQFKWRDVVARFYQEVEACLESPEQARMTDGGGADGKRTQLLEANVIPPDCDR